MGFAGRRGEWEGRVGRRKGGRMVRRGLRKHCIKWRRGGYFKGSLSKKGVDQVS